jgi:hypothetical protein
MNLMQRNTARARVGAGIATIILAVTVLPDVMNVMPASAQEFADPAFERVWDRTDSPKVLSQVSRTYFWGPAPGAALREEYLDAPSCPNICTRLVQYFDKSRMEINNPNADRNSTFYVTNGLLTVELISGRMQIGNNAFEQRISSNIPVAGDTYDTQAPTYTSFRSVSNTSLGDHRQEPHVGDFATATIDRGARVGNDESKRAYPLARIAYFEPSTGHNIPAAFWNFLNSTGPVKEGDQIVNKRLIDPWFYASGLPISDPYWASVIIGGRPRQSVMIQAFERRVLTYVPSNDPNFQVEMGNIGQHYYDWRYKDVGTPTPGCTPTVVSYQAGINDNFAQPTDPASPSARQIEWAISQHQSLRDFDDTRIDGVLNHTFTGLTLQGMNICTGTLEIHLKPMNTSVVTNDTLGFNSDETPPTGWWSHSIGPASYPTGNVSGLPPVSKTWNPANYPSGVTILLDLNHLPNSTNTDFSQTILQRLQDTGKLRFGIQDDTSVDYMILRLSYSCSPCSTAATPTPISTPTATSVPPVPTDGFVIFTSNRSGKNQIWRVKPDGVSNAESITPGSHEGCNADFAVYSPKFNRIAFASNCPSYGASDDIYVMVLGDDDGKPIGQPRRLTTSSDREFSPTWSPDGSRIAYISNSNGSNGSYDIWTMRSDDGTDKRSIINSPYVDTEPSWGANNLITFTSRRPSVAQIYTMNPNSTSTPVQITTAGENYMPRWNHRGDSIVFGSNRNGRQEIYTMRADGGGQTLLTNNTVFDRYPAYAYNDNGIVFAETQGDGSLELWTMNLNGVLKGKIASKPSSNEYHPDWGRLPLR